MTKKCSKCSKIKSIDEFYKKSKSKDGYQAQCKWCTSKQQIDNKVKKNARLTIQRKLRSVAQKAVDAKVKRKGRLKSEYGITLTEYDQMIENQDGVCAICKTRETQNNQHGLRRLAVDHNHETGEVRGLLCNKCNLGISYFADDPKVLAEAIRYLL